MSLCQFASDSTSVRMFPALWTWNQSVPDAASDVEPHCQIDSEPWLTPRAPELIACQVSWRNARS